MLWAVYGFLHSLLRAGMVEAARPCRMDGGRRAFLQAFFALLLLVPFVPFMRWPAEGYFYAAAVGVAVIYTLGMIIQLNLAERRQGRVSSIYMPLEALTAIAFWIALRPWLLQAHLDDVFMTLAVIAAFGLCVAGVLRIRQADISGPSFLLVAPVGITYAIAGVITKIVIPPADVLAVVLAYALVNFATMAFILGAVLISKNSVGRELFSRPTVKSGLVIGLLSLAAYMTFVLSVVEAPNPGYTSLMAMLLPVWLFGWHRARGREGHADPLAVVMIMLGIMLLIAINL